VFKDGIIYNGKGTKLHWDNKILVKGHWKEGKLDGLIKIDYGNGSYASCVFNNGVAHGKMQLYDKSRKTHYGGYYQNGRSGYMYSKAYG
jgi:antitoxin component YwqK of YwqJK toxin-antitoxin module